MTLDLFAPRTFSELQTEHNQTEISVHCSRRLRSSWYVKFRRGSSSRELYIPDCFEQAPDQVKIALLEWAMLPRLQRGEKKRIMREHRSNLETRIRTYLNECSATVPRRQSRPPTQKWPTGGCRYDLREIFDTLNNRFFHSTLTSFLRWGTGPTKTSFQTTRRDASGAPYHCITIAGVYNHPDVPRFAIESIMYHEMLHIHIPPRKERGRNIIHGADFKRAEQAFPHYTLWRQWERENFHRLRTALRRKQKKTLLQRVIDLFPGV